MSRSLRTIRRLRAAVAELDRYERELEIRFPRLAEDHLLRVITVFRYGDPQIAEPLELAYGRGLAHLAGMVRPYPGRRATPITEAIALEHLAGILEREGPADDLRSEISASVRQMPDWLRHLCETNFSMTILGLDVLPRSNDVLKLQRKKSDWYAWPHLPREMLEPSLDHGERYRFMKEMSWEERFAFRSILERPEQEWTRREHRFIVEMLNRDSSGHELDKDD
jgi:hypothetical protein